MRFSPPAYDRFGVRLGHSAMPAQCPVWIAFRTQLGDLPRSELCQEATCAPQQTTPVAVGTRVSSHAPRTEPYGRLSRIRLVWGFLCQGCITPFLSRVVTPFFCSTRAASILPSRPHIAAAVARSGGQGRRFFSAAEGLSLTDASTAAGCP